MPCAGFINGQAKVSHNFTIVCIGFKQDRLCQSRVLKKCFVDLTQAQATFIIFLSLSFFKLMAEVCLKVGNIFDNNLEFSLT